MILHGFWPPWSLNKALFLGSRGLDFGGPQGKVLLMVQKSCTSWYVVGTLVGPNKGRERCSLAHYLQGLYITGGDPRIISSFNSIRRYRARGFLSTRMERGCRLGCPRKLVYKWLVNGLFHLYSSRWWFQTFLCSPPKIGVKTGVRPHLDPNHWNPNFRPGTF